MTAQARQAAQPPLIRYDLHCHLNFAADAANVLGAAPVDGALCATVTPRDYLDACAALAAFPAVRVGLGLHPWRVADESDGMALSDKLALFEELTVDAPFVAEVGLDFGRAHAGTRDAQISAFKRIIAACEGNGAGKTLSLHAVRSAGALLDLLEEADALRRHRCILHWFSGTSDELHRAASAGCWFSVGSSMLAGKRGRAYAAAVPLERLCLETDLPRRAGDPFDALQWQQAIDDAFSALAAVRRENPAAVAKAIERNSLRLLNRPSGV